MNEPAKVVLSLDQCSIRFGGLAALSDISFKIHEHQLVGLIGPNGAGKTTVFNLLTGIYRPTSGSIQMEGQELAGKSPHVIASMGIARTFQNIRLFPSMSVMDNVRVAMGLHSRAGFLQAIWRGKKFFADEAAIRNRVVELLQLFRLESVINEPANCLPYGAQRRLEIVRALATQPRLLLLDEPAAGMNPTEKQELMQSIRLLEEKYRIAILLVEHDMKVVMGTCEQVIVLDHGVMIAEGSPDEVQRNPRVIEAYLGQELKL